MTGSIAVSQCGHTPNRPGHHGTVVASTVGTVAISCNVAGALSVNVAELTSRIVHPPPLTLWVCGLAISTV